MSNLRPLDLADAPAVFAAVDCSRDALRRWMVWYRDEYDVDDAKSWIEQTLASRADGTGFHFAICSIDGTLLGVIGIEDVSETTGRAMLGYWVATPATGRGVATRAVEQVLGWARTQTGIRLVWALVAEANERSRRVVESNGFRVAGVRERDERGDVPLVYELEVRAPTASSDR
jgi:ribosomal-protein-serine acetyltransferase